MSKNVVRALLAATGGLTAVSAVYAQAPLSNQRWEVRFVVDSSGPLAAGPGATAVGITMQARVGIIPNSTISGGTANFGVSRVGGATQPGTAPFSISFFDAAQASIGRNQGTLGRGATGQTFNDVDGQPIAGLFSAFRGSLPPGTAPFMGDNDNTTSNGMFTNPASGSPFVTNILGSRSNAFGADGTTGPVGVATLDAGGNIIGGDFADVYRMVYFPSALSGGDTRTVRVSVNNITGRYLFRLNGDPLNGPVTASASTQNFFISGSGTRAQTFEFVIPSPGAAALLGLGGLVAARRRRA